MAGMEQGDCQEKRRESIPPEQMAVVNAMNKAETARHRLLEYFGKGSYFLTLTYRVEARPPDMAKAKKDFTNLISKLRTRYKKEQIELRWIRNIEKGTKGAWHVHMVITGCRDTIRWVEECWPHGGIYAEQLEKSKYYEEDFSQLASYITKNEKVGEKREDGKRDKPRLSESSYSTSRNMPLKPPKRKNWQDGQKRSNRRTAITLPRAMKESIRLQDSNTGDIH